MLKGFRDFILQGMSSNSQPRSSSAVPSPRSSLRSPTRSSTPIAAVGGAEGPALSFQIKPNVPETTIDLGAVITAAINFLIVAAIVYFIIIVPMNKLNELRKRGAPEEEVPPTTEDLLGDIREILRNQTAAAAGPAEGPATDGPIDPNQLPRH